MNTEIEYLKTLELDLTQAGKREQLLEPTRPTKRRSRMSWGTFAAAIIPVLVVAGLIGWLTTGGVDSSSSDSAGGTSGPEQRSGIASGTAAPAAGYQTADLSSGDDAVFGLAGNALGD